MNVSPDFPMSTARRVRDGRWVLLWPDPAEWPDEVVKGPPGDVKGPNAVLRARNERGAVIGQWDRDERTWTIFLDGEWSHFNAIDDDFLGWANLPPVDGAP